jgi:predicted Zn finger-like uncharacterized protein
MIVSCSQCGVKLKVDETKIKDGGSKLRCPKCQNVFTVYKPQEGAPAPAPVQAAPPPAPAPRPAPAAAPPPREEAAPKVEKWELDRRKVVVAHAGDTVTAMAKELLSGAGFETVTASDGVHAMMEIERHRPAVAVLDVALPSIFGFEICDRLKNDQRSSDVKVILIASIYDKTRYKREPASLYGADDYIEKHHIQDALTKKVNRLLSPISQPPGVKVPREEERFMPPPPSELSTREKHADRMREEEIKQFVAPSPVDNQQVEAARRFARIILSDIALYNQGAVEDGIKKDNFQQVLSEELKEGRELYNSRVPEEVRSQMDYFADEMEKFIEKKKQIMEMGG